VNVAVAPAAQLELIEAAIALLDRPHPRVKGIMTPAVHPGAALAVLLWAVCWIAGAPRSLGASEVRQATDPRRPNILVVFTDDHGWADLAAQGVDDHIRTPQIDALAAAGVRFSRGYVTAPQCVPSRAGLLTGIHQNRFGVEDNQKGPLPHAVVTLPERLRELGYVTGMSGKWHLDVSHDRARAGGAKADPEFLPHRHGFDEYWCGAMQRYDASHALDGTPFADAPRTVSDRRFRITVQTEAALGFLERHQAEPDRPWFLYVPYFGPHVPLESPEPWFSRTPEDLPLERRQALAIIAAIDDGVGRLRDKIRELGQEQDTLVFCIGDNGAPLKEGGWDGSLNLPLVGEKGLDAATRCTALPALKRHRLFSARRSLLIAASRWRAADFDFWGSL
jgi:arylsulfatase A-like enzyme